MTPYGFKSFAEVVAGLGKLTQLETAISKAIEQSKVPSQETRKFIKSQTPDQLRNVALFQFMKELFKDIGLGEMDVSRVDNFKLYLSFASSQVCEIYPKQNKKMTCYITSDALSRFFSEDLGLPADVSEIECCNKGSPTCIFEIGLQPLAVYQMVLDSVDRSIISSMIDGKSFDESINEMSLDKSEAEYRHSTLKRYHVIEEERVTEIGKTYHKYGGSLFNEEEDNFPPPWVEYSRIAGEIASTASFAEAVSETTDDSTEEINEKEVTSMTEEAKKSHSFAELIAKKVKEGEN
ncbi:MAG TPA: hypothetical protein ENN76_01685 [Euryarchaeota archaeon]|nr:hypothetical protein [Euryarchaeota archaeon]